MVCVQNPVQQNIMSNALFKRIFLVVCSIVLHLLFRLACSLLKKISSCPKRMMTIFVIYASFWLTELLELSKQTISKISNKLKFSTPKNTDIGKIVLMKSVSTSWKLIPIKMYASEQISPTRYLRLKNGYTTRSYSFYQKRLCHDPHLGTHPSLNTLTA